MKRKVTIRGIQDSRGAFEQRGFTLIELLVTMVLLAVMLTLAAPSFLSFQRNSELTSSANAFVAALSAARAEAMKRQLRVFVVPVETTRTNWAAGWKVFVDTDGSVTSETAAELDNSGTDILISEQGAMPTSVSVDTSSASGFFSGGVRYVMFNGSGFMTGVSGTFSVVHGLDLTNGGETRRIIANTTGRLRVCKPPPADASCVVSDAL